MALGQSRKPAVRSGAWREPSAALESSWEMGIDEEPPREKHTRLFHCEVNVSEQGRKTISVSMSRTSKPTSVRLSHTCRGSDPDTHSAVKEGHALLLRTENNARPGRSGEGWRIPSPFPQLPSSETQRLPKGQAARLPAFTQARL